MGMTSGELQQPMPLDMEWVKLMMVAKDMGFTIEDVRRFMKQCLANDSTGKD